MFSISRYHTTRKPSVILPIRRIIACTMLMRFIFWTFIFGTTMTAGLPEAPPASSQSIAVFAHKYPPLSNEASHLLQALQLTVLSHCPENITCFFIDPRDVVKNPKKFAPFLARCSAWVGPMLAEETLNVVNALAPLIPQFPGFFSFSNNSGLLAHAVTPLGPSPLHDIPVVLRAMHTHVVQSVLVLAPRRWAEQTTNMVVKHMNAVKVFFFFYDQKPPAEMTEELEQALRTYGPDTLFAPFGDITTLELLSNSISFISNHVGLKPFVVGTSSWSQGFLTDLSLIGALYTKLPLSQKGLEFQKEFHHLFGVQPPNIAITACDALCVAFTTAKDGPQDSLETCRGTLSLTPEGAFYHPKVQTL